MDLAAFDFFVGAITEGTKEEGGGGGDGDGGDRG